MAGCGRTGTVIAALAIARKLAAIKQPLVFLLSLKQLVKDIIIKGKTQRHYICTNKSSSYYYYCDYAE